MSADDIKLSPPGEGTAYQRVHIERPQLNQPQFDELYSAGGRPGASLRACLAGWREACQCSGRCVGRKLLGFLPFIKIMKEYNWKEWLVVDIIAGLTIGIMQIPQGLAYSVLAELDAVVGLYVSFFPVLLYFFLGTSRHISLGTFAVLSLMVGSTVMKFDCSQSASEDDNTGLEATTEMWTNATDGYEKDEAKAAEMACKLGIATALTFIAGLIQLGMGLLNLGFVVQYLPVPLTRGFTTGCSIHVFTSQVKYVIGISSGRYAGPWKLIYTYRDLFVNITSINWAAVVLSLVCMVIIYITKEYLNPPFKKRFKAPIPIDLLIVILGTVASHYGDFEERFGLKVVGEIPTGIPPPAFPPVSRFPDVILDAVTVAVVGFAVSVSMAQLYASKYNYETDPNQELVAHGVCNAVASSFNCYVMAVSLSRTAVLDSIGCKTQLHALCSCVLILFVIYFIAPLFEAAPNCVLAAIIIIALKGLFRQFQDIKKYWKISGTDMSIWVVTFVAVVLLDVGLGLVVGVVYGLLTVVGRTQKPYNCVLGRMPNSADYRDKTVYPRAEEVDGVAILRFENSVYYANKDYFVSSVFSLSDCDPRRLKVQQAKAHKAHLKAPVHHVVLDCSAMSYVDSMGISTLRQVACDYKEVDVEVLFSGMNDGVRGVLGSGGFLEKVELEQLFPSVHDAVLHALQGHPEQHAKLLSGVVDVTYKDESESDATTASLYKGEMAECVERLQIEEEQEVVEEELEEGFTNPGLVVDDIMDPDEDLFKTAF